MHLSSKVTIIGDFFSHFVGGGGGGIMAATRQDRGKRHLLGLILADEAVRGLTELSWSDVRCTCASSRHFLLTQRKRKKSLNI